MSRVRFLRIASVMAVLFAVLVAGSAEARAESARCTFFEIEASSGDGGIDEQLKPLAKKLEKPPFSSWNTFEALDKHSKKLARMKAQEIKLAVGGKLSALYRDLIQAKGKKDRLRMSVTMDDRSGKRILDTTFAVDEGDYILIGGQTLPGGATYILAISCK